MGDRVDETKAEPSRDASEDSLPSSPEQDGDIIPDQPQPQKRKGGRKPIYATSEERKQRNRQAQAAFRERRTEYIKQLETTIKHHEDTLQTLQQSHRTAADECLMLRYKNSLLERVLLEKGIDVQAELRVKTGSPNLHPVRVPPAPIPPPQTAQRVSTVGKGHQPRRYVTHPQPPKVDTTPQMAPLPESVLTSIPNPSPRSQPTPSQSHFSSPATAPTRSPNFLPQQGGSIISPNLAPQGSQQRYTQPPLRPNIAPMQPPQRPTMPTSYNSGSTVSSNSPIVAGAQQQGPTSAVNPNAAKGVYSNPFQSHYDQLDEEYDNATDMADADDVQSPQVQPYPQTFQQPGRMQPPPQPMHTTPHLGPQQTTPHMGPQQGTPHLGPQQQPIHQTPTLGPQQQAQQSPFQQPQDGQHANGQFNNMAQQVAAQPNMFFDPYDPMLDADPFGLSASMHFPTQFSYDAR